MSSPQQQVVAVENALTGEKKFRTVHYAITGDDELDTLSGLIAVLNGEPNRVTQVSFSRIVGLLEYLLARYRSTEQQFKGLGQGFGYPPQGYVGGSPSIAQLTPQVYTNSAMISAPAIDNFPAGLLDNIMAQNRNRP